MRTHKFINWFIFLTVIYFSCDKDIPQKPNTGQQLKEKIIGSWCGVWQNEYREMYIVNDSTFLSIQDSVYYHIPYSYWWIGEDTIQFSNLYFKYKVFFDGDTLQLLIKDRLFKYERIKPNPVSLSEEFYDGFVIRKCNFLASKGMITYKEAYKQIYNYIVFYNLLNTTNYEVEEEYIQIRKAP